VRLVSFDALTGEEIDAWHALRVRIPAPDSPFFHPGFAAAVHASGRPVSVIVVRGVTGAVAALVPGHRKARGCDRRGGQARTSRDRCSRRARLCPRRTF
jgi:hypothetical protein